MVPFQLTTSRRGRLNCNPDNPRHWFLSTHDLTQRSTRLMSPCPMVAFLSTHDLTQRSTLRSLRLLVRRDLSTHDLTQRSTHPSLSLESFCPFNSRSHAEVDLSACFLKCTPDAFQLTTSRRGRLFQVSFLHTDQFLSTHDLTQRSTGISLPFSL